MFIQQNYLMIQYQHRKEYQQVLIKRLLRKNMEMLLTQLRLRIFTKKETASFHLYLMEITCLQQFIMQLQSKIPVKKTKIIACICLIVLIVVCSVLSNKEISKHKNDSSQNVSDDINIQKKTTIETSELQEKNQIYLYHQQMIKRQMYLLITTL